MRRLVIGSVIAALVGLAPIAIPSEAVASCGSGGRVTVTPDPAFEAMFDAYGDDNSRTDDWTGADGVYSIPVGDDTVVWNFSDTFLGTVNADGSRPNTAPLINNDLVIQKGDRLVRTVHGGTAADPTSLVTPSDASWYWMGDGVVEGPYLRIFLPKYTRTGPGAWDWKWSGTDIASFSLRTGRTATITRAPAAGVAYGAAVLVDGGYTYVYGVEDLATENYLHVARVSNGNLLGMWEYATATGWSLWPRDSARLLTDVDTGFGVAHVGAGYQLFTLDTTTPFSGEIVIYTSCSPVGPWTNETPVYSTPENDASTFTYGVRVHPEFPSDAGLLLSYNVNSWTWAGSHEDVGNYRPRFLRVALT
jgi:hypothetical protein